MLANKAVVVPVGLSADQSAKLARRLAGEGAAVVLVAPAGSTVAGTVAAGLAARAAVLVLTGDDASDLDALVELLGELFP